MSTKQITAGFIALSISLGALAQESSDAVPVIIQEGDVDPCSYGRVHGLDPKGDGFLAVRAGPGGAYARLDKIIENQTVFICGQKGDWYAIVYTRGSEDCGVSSPWSKSRSYSGPCRSGWAHRKWIEILAG